MKCGKPERNCGMIRRMAALCALLLLLTACGEREVGSAKLSSETETPTAAAEGGTVVGTEAAENGAEGTGAESESETETDGGQPAEGAQEAPEIRLVMTGDMLLHTPVEECARQDDGTYRYDAIFEHVAPVIAAADVAIVNQEVIIGGEALGISGYPCFNAPFSFGDALMEAGFDVICHATNHALDKRKYGLLNCLDYWKTSHPEAVVLGIYETREARDSIYVYEKDGIRIAFLNYTYGTNGIELPADMPFAVDLMERERVIADIHRAEEMADFTVVCPHWGTEYRLTPDDYQRRWTKLFLENGADLVIGTHPHVIEPVEWVEDEETGRKMLVYYSLGNFVNWTSSSGEGIANRMVGGLAEVTLTRDESGMVTVSDYGVRAVVTHLEKRMNGVSVYLLADYTEELAEKNAIRGQDAAFSRGYCERLCDQVWGSGNYR